MTDPSQTADSDLPQKRRGTRLVRWLAWLGLTTLLIVSVLGLALTYWFPSELVRTTLEEQLSARLDGHVAIAALSFNALTGLELKNLTFHQRGQQILALERLNLDYSVLGLFRGTLLINEVLIDQATVNLNLLEFAPPAPSQPHPSTPAPESRSLPVLPLAIDLQAFVIQDTDLQLRASPTLAVALTDVDLDLSGAVGAEQATLTGLLNIAHAALDMNGRHLEFPVQLAFSLTADLPSQIVEIQHFAIESPPALRASLSGHLEDMFTTPHIDVSLNKTEIDIQPLLTIAKNFLPPNISALPMEGHIAFALDLEGVHADSGFQGVVDLDILTSDLHAVLPTVAAEIETTDLAVRLEGINIRNNVPQFGKLTLTASDTDLRYQDLVVTDARVSATSEYFAVGPFSGTVKASGVMTTPAHHPFPSYTLPFAFHLDANGNYNTQELALHTLAVRFGELLSLESQGQVRPGGSAHDDLQVSFMTRIEPRLAGILTHLPSPILDGVTIQKTGDTPDVVAIELSGVVDPTYQPKAATITVGLKLADLTASMDALPAGGTLNRANVLIAADYRGENGQFTGTIGSRLAISNAYQGHRLAIGQTTFVLKSQFEGAVTTAFTPTTLQMHDQLTIELRDLIYDEPSLKAELDRVTVKSETFENLFEQIYRVKSLHIQSDPLMDLAVQGSYHASDQRFNVGVTLSKLDLHEMFRHLSGRALDPILISKPQGTIYVTSSASGHMPKSWAFGHGEFPIRFESLLSLRNVSGTVAGHSLRNAHGSIAISFQPGTHATATLATDLQAATIRLANLGATLPEAFAKIKLVVQNFDELHIETAQAGITGAHIAAHGTVSGIKSFLAEAPPIGTSVERLFARLSTTASLDLIAAQDLLAGLDMKGRGTSRINLAVLKKGRGPLDLKLDIEAQDLHLQYHDIAITDLDGTLSFHKHLAWKGQSAPPLKRRLTPSDLLSQLHTLGRQGKRLTIHRIDLGWLTLSNLSTSILFDQTDLKIHNLAVNLLGGGFGGTALMRMGSAPAISANFEAAHLDLNELLTDRQKISGDSRIDATMRLALLFDEDTGTIDLHRSILDVYITHIGREALDRLLLFLDPKGSNPTLVAARAQVHLANPSQVTLRIGRGLLGLKIVFREGLLSSFAMNRIPIGSLAEMLNVTHIPQWERIVAMTTLIGASIYSVDTQGHLHFE